MQKRTISEDSPKEKVLTSWIRKWASVIAGAVFIMSVVDALLTIAGIEAGHIEELNPIMGFFLDISPALFFVVKSSMVGAGLWFVLRNLNARPAVPGIALSFIAYVVVLGIHAVWITTVFG